MSTSSTTYPPAISIRPPREPAPPSQLRIPPTAASTSVIADSSPPSYQNLHDDDSTPNHGADLQQIPADDLSTLTSRSTTSSQETDPVNESSGGNGAGNKPPPIPPISTTSRIRPAVSSPILSTSPLSAHPRSPAFAYYPYYMRSMFSVTTRSE